MEGNKGAILTAFLVLLLPIVWKRMKISADKYSCGLDIRIDVLAGKEKIWIFWIFRYFNQI